jgi:hypothetical protein
VATLAPCEVGEARRLSRKRKKQHRKIRSYADAAKTISETANPESNGCRFLL